MKKGFLSLLDRANIVSFFGGNAEPLMKRLEGIWRNHVISDFPASYSPVCFDCNKGACEGCSFGGVHSMDGLRINNLLNEMYSCFSEIVLASDSHRIQRFLECKQAIHAILSQSVTEGFTLSADHRADKQDERMRAYWMQGQIVQNK